MTTTQVGRWTRFETRSLADIDRIDRLWGVDGRFFATGYRCPPDGVDGCGGPLSFLASDDGIGWTELGTIDVAGVIGDLEILEERFVAEGGSEDEGDGIWISDDGSAWEWLGEDPVFDPGADGGPTPDAAVSTIYNLTHVPDGLVATGRASCRPCEDAGSDRVAIWSSPDGRQWDRVPYDAIGEQSILHLGDVFEGHGELVAWTGQQILTSLDGIAWTVVGADLELTDVAAIRGTGLGERYLERAIWGYPEDARTADVLVRFTSSDEYDPIVWWTSDGRGWESEPLPVTHTAPYDYSVIENVAVVGRRVVISGYDRFYAEPEDTNVPLIWVADLGSR